MPGTQVSAVDIVIFGGSGDLTARKLLPSLYLAHRDGALPPQFRVICVGRHRWGDAEFRNFLDNQARPFVEKQHQNDEAWNAFTATITWRTLDATEPEDYLALKPLLDDNTVRVFFLAMASTLFESVCRNLNAAGLNTPQTRIVLEKPLGTDLASAKAINATVGEVFAERQIYRIDHYLGKETVQNLIALRFGNAIFEPLWRAPTIKSVQITVAETVGVGTRGEFYDATGAMRDMIQNHLMQVLCIVAMEPPASLDPDAVRDEKMKVLRSLKPMKLADIARDTVRGVYSAGTIKGEPIAGYHNSKGIPADSDTETFVALRTEVNTWRWANVPFFLRTGKAMQDRVSEVVIDFADVPHSVFGDAVLRHNRLVISLQRDDSVRLHLMTKEPGDGMHVRPVSLAFDFKNTFATRRADAYERLLLDVIRGRQTLFVRHDELEAAWAWAEPIIEGWKKLGERPRPYAAGSWGPAAASALIARDGAHWHEEM